MKKTALILSLAMAGTMLLTGCGDSDKASSAKYEAAPQNNYAADYAESGEANYDSESVDEGGITQTNYKQSAAKAIDTQMLIYSCDMSIDVLEFDKAVDEIHDLIKSYDGFIESENYSDGGSSGQWIYSDTQKWKNLNATIRVPSAKYDDFCKATEEIGDLRRKNSSVQNLTTEYSDLKTTLSIYEAKEQRYLDILADIKNESEAISVENELTSIQVEIAKIKTRMNNIENDVAYSYIHLNVNEVREYTEKPVVEKTDTFGQRLKNRLSKTWSGFLNFLEVVLFIVISVFPYALFIALIVFVFVMFIKLLVKIGDRRARKRQQQRLQQTSASVQPPQANADTPAPKDSEKADK
ncbi:MAG: DUF4349 domain-containing protein [Ruminococcus sp.]|nr:DUF4349 domain-containing protein [Ruminococcus sp.]